jgi:DNA-binding CsgD family transcriptional regulator
MIAYRSDPQPDRLAPVLMLRKGRIRMVIVDCGLTIVGADSFARGFLDDLGPASPGRLPYVLEAALRFWAPGDREAHLVATPLPGVVVHAMQLDGDPSYIGILLERTCTREELTIATQRFGLSRREVDVVRLLLDGDSACEIAQQLGIAEYTVGDYLKRLFMKTRVRNRSEMIAKVLGWRSGEVEQTHLELIEGSRT